MTSSVQQVALLHFSLVLSENISDPREGEAVT